MLVIQSVLLSVVLSIIADAQTKDALNKFSIQTVIHPQVYHGRSKKAIQTTLDEVDGLHADRIILSYIHNGQRVRFELLRNDRLIPDNHFLRYQNGSKNTTESGTAGHVVRYFTQTEVDLCHYKGHIRGQPDSKVALSTCNGGLDGIIFDGQKTYFIHPQFDGNGQLHDDHYLISDPHMTQQNATWGYNMRFQNEEEKFQSMYFRRRRRDTEDSGALVRGPFNGNKYTSFVELVMVVDNKAFKNFNGDTRKTHQYCKDLINIVNALYEPLNIFVILMGVVIWNESDEIEITDEANKTLKKFLEYRRTVLIINHPNDNAHLLSGHNFARKVLGKARKGAMCTFDNSGGLSRLHNKAASVVATTIAHELGHNFDMDHDNPNCNCPDEKCIMNGASTSVMPVHWSSCSIDQLTIAFSRGMNYCLRNKPLRLFDSPQCGNGFVEPGEQCDCGLPNHCENPCCNAYTCMLHSNASCATGECCNLQTCRPKLAGSSCREAESECDLPEYCTGESEYCPTDVYRRDAEPCDGGQAFCFHGTCRSHANQCRVLWGPTGDNSEHCYYKNTDGNRTGNCGYNHINEMFVPCATEHVNCGRLHCIHLNERLETDIAMFAKLSHSYAMHDRKIVDCRSAVVDLGLQNDPGLTPNGAKCGDNKMCIDQRCVAVEQVLAKGKDCPETCGVHGVCNSRGHCHCDLGYGGGSCTQSGSGGSVDSGPIIILNHGQRLQYLYLLFLLIIPLVAVIWLIYLKQIFTKKETGHVCTEVPA